MIAAADEMDDLELVAILDQHLGQRRARHHLEIALDRDLAGLEPEHLACELRQRDAGGDAAMLAIDHDAEGAVCLHGCAPWERSI